MPSATLTDTYKRCQEDTTAFTTWLGQVAQSCGWKPASKPRLTTPNLLDLAAKISKAPRLKGKDRKLAREAAKLGAGGPQPTHEAPSERYVVTPKTLLEQAELVAKVKKGRLKLPDGVRRVLERALETRKRCVDWFRRTDVTNRYTTTRDAHQQIIDALEEAARILEQNQKKGRSRDGIPNLALSLKDVDVTSHYLASLKIEEEADEDNFGMNLSNISQLSHSATQPPSRAVYEVQTEPDMERSFRIFCVLEDTHLMQHEVRKAWHLFATHKMALITATTITTVAIGLVGRAEAQLIADYPGAINPSHSYRDMVLALSTEDMEASTFGEFLYLPVGRTLMCIAQQHGNFGGHDYPVPLHRIKSPSHDGPRPVGAPHRLRTQDDDEFIYQLVQDFSLLEEFQRADSEFRSRDRASELRTEYLPTFDDIFQDAIRCVWKAGEVQMRSVFATRALLDILDICPNFKGVPLLHEEGRRQYELFEFFMDEEGALDNASGFRWHTKDWPLVKEIHDRVTAQMAGPGFVEHKKVMLEEYSKRRQGLVDRKCTDEPPPEEHTLTSPNLPAKRPRTDGAPILHEETVETCERSEKRTEEDVAPNPDPALYIKKNPLFCGTLMLCQTMSTEAAGVALANHHMSLFGVAHLYNAFQALKIIDIIWPDMERAISVHADAFFANEIPTTPQEMRTQMFFRLGIDRSMHPIPDRKNEEKKYIATSSASLLLLQFFRQTQPLETSIYQMQEDLRQRQLKVSQPHDASSPHAAITPLTSLSLRTFFIQLEQFATAALSDAQFPYLGLTKLCIHLLQSVREALEANKYPVPRRSNTDDSNDMSLILMVADLLNNNSVVWTKSGKKKEPCKGLKLAAKEFERMWADWQSDEFKQVRHKYFPDDVGER